MLSHFLDLPITERQHFQQFHGRTLAQLILSIIVLGRVLLCLSEELPFSGHG